MEGMHYHMETRMNPRGAWLKLSGTFDSPEEGIDYWTEGGTKGQEVAIRGVSCSCEYGNMKEVKI